jgi:glycosyltransferase involved in cell wall biosynthesis
MQPMIPKKITAAIITFNEERNIERCILSLIDCVDEILVVDSFSTDKTEEICKKYKVRFVQNPFEGHIEQKNVALQLATFDWVLSLDADEALTAKLKESVLKAKKEDNFGGYQLNRLTNYCGKWVRYCGWYPDTKIRLVNKNNAKWQGVNPHDRLDVLDKSTIGQLEGDLLHYSYYTKEDHFKQIQYFGKIAANELIKKGKKASLLKIGIKTIAQFFKSFLLKRGFLDGKTGLLISIRSAYATYVKYSLVRKFTLENESK